MTTSGWKWGPSFDERERAHPDIVTYNGGLPRKETARWNALVDAVRVEAKAIGLWVTE